MEMILCCSAVAEDAGVAVEIIGKRTPYAPEETR